MKLRKWKFPSWVNREMSPLECSTLLKKWASLRHSVRMEGSDLVLQQMAQLKEGQGILAKWHTIRLRNAWKLQEYRQQLPGIVHTMNLSWINTFFFWIVTELIILVCWDQLCWDFFFLVILSDNHLVYSAILNKYSGIINKPR